MGWQAVLNNFTQDGMGNVTLNITITDSSGEIITTALGFMSSDPNFTKDTIQQRVALLARGFGKIDFLNRKVGKIIATEKGLNEGSPSASASPSASVSPSAGP
jgi:hypothetical protein